MKKTIQFGFAICFICFTVNSGNGSQIRPEFSSGVLMNTLHLIYKKIGIFPDGISPSRRVLIRNIYSGNCISMKADDDGGFTKAIEAPCKGANINDNQLVHIRHVGCGFVSLSPAGNHCLGAGFDSWSYVYVSKSETWCEKSPSHHWFIIQVGNEVIFKQRESKRCLTSWPKWEELFLDDNDCKMGDPYQGYQICDQTGTKCWPPNATEKPIQRAAL